MKSTKTKQICFTHSDTIRTSFIASGREIQKPDGLFGWPLENNNVHVGAGNESQHLSEGDLDQDIPKKIMMEDQNGAQLNKKLEEILNDMNLSEKQKSDVCNLPESSKRNILVNYYKDRTKLDKPSVFIRFLNMSDLSLEKLYNCIASLKVSLANNPISWVEEFGSEGLNSLLHALNRCYSSNDRKYHQVQYECLRCIWFIMNNIVGLKEIFRQKEVLVMVVRSLEASCPLVMVKALQILAEACLVPPDGHGKVLEAITINGEVKDCDRFAPIIAGLQVSSNDSLRVHCMQLINAIVSIPDEVDFKIHLRNEIMRVGLANLLEVLEKDASEELSVQLKVFHNEKDDDFYVFSKRFDT